MGNNEQMNYEEFAKNRGLNLDWHLDEESMAFLLDAINEYGITDPSKEASVLVIDGEGDMIKVLEYLLDKMNDERYKHFKTRVLKSFALRGFSSFLSFVAETQMKRLYGMAESDPARALHTLMEMKRNLDDKKVGGKENG